MEFKDAITALGILITLGIGIYNIIRSKSIQNMVDSLLLDDIRFEAEHLAIDTQAIREKSLILLRKQSFELKKKLISTTTTIGKETVQEAIDIVEERINILEEGVKGDEEVEESCRKLTADTVPDRELIKAIKRNSGEIKSRYSRAKLQSVKVNHVISETDNVLATAK